MGDLNQQYQWLHETQSCNPESSETHSNRNSLVDSTPGLDSSQPRGLQGMLKPINNPQWTEGKAVFDRLSLKPVFSGKP